MSASLVGSEMCIRDSPVDPGWAPALRLRFASMGLATHPCIPGNSGGGDCLLYTSDAADDM
eukprot:1225296-Alexandrium_andersonii.AAC.1